MKVENKTMTTHTSRDATRDRRGLRILLAGEETDDRLSLVDCVVPPATSGPPLHTHPESDETFVVLSGRVLVHVEGRLHEAGPGDVVHVPRGVAHTFATPAGAAAHFVTVHNPGGFERFHVAAATAERERGEPLDRDALVGIARGFDWSLAGPPLLPTGDLAGRP